MSEFACSVASLLPGAGIAVRDGTCLAVEGWLTRPDLPPNLAESELPACLLDLFLLEGPGFVEALRGSFQIAIHSCRDGGETWLLADPVASRRLFYRPLATGGLAFAPEVAPLAGLERAAVDPANLLQFLIAGRFFAGESLLDGVRLLLPGEALHYRAGQLRRHFYYRYEAGPEREGDVAALTRELERVLDRAVLSAFERAKDPVFLLSGGYDSRYLFHTVARSMADPGSLRTALFGQRMDLPGSDNAIARAVARRFGVKHLELPWRSELLPEQFSEMFAAQSGMTELIFTHSDELAVFGALAEEHGFGSVLRGDECFGPRGGEVLSSDQALGRVAMARALQV
ncbi:MAG TPA: asparagine synthase-related protein, partial [Thermoanaerobaculia bacterium]|nr:asparagine synthase-related protein [Thermoanaerobaculia bacterium]